MYLFTRMRTAKSSRAHDAVTYGIRVRDFIREHTNTDVSLHQTVWGRPIGTLVLGGLVSGRAAVLDLKASLETNPDYRRLTEGGHSLFEDNGTDQLRLLVQTNGIDLETDEAQPLFSQGWAARIANGQFDHAMTWATDMAAYFADLTGAGIVTMSDSYGPFGTITWMAGFDTAAQADEVDDKLTTDPEWVKRLNYAEDLFLPGSGTGWFNRRIG